MNTSTNDIRQQGQELLAAKRSADAVTLRPLEHPSSALDGRSGSTANSHRPSQRTPPAPSKRLQDLLVRYPDKYSLDPATLRYTCPKCGVQEPHHRSDGVYTWRECRCEYLAREAEEQRQFLARYRQEQGARMLHAAYAWLDQYNPAMRERHGLLQFACACRLESCTFAEWDKSRFPSARASAAMLADHIICQHVQQHVQNLLFVGTPGTGKTHLLAAIIAEITAHGFTARFCTAKNLFDALYSASFPDKAEILHQLGTCPLWGLDELDKLPIGERGGDYQRNTLQDILNARNRRRLPTVITANERNDFSRWLDASALSRLLEGGRVEVMIGEDYRLLRGQAASLWGERGQ